MNRKIIVAGNWKMNFNLSDALKLTGALAKQVSSSRGMEIVICPPFPFIIPIIEQFRNENRDISVGGQNCHEATSGAYTGEIAASMLASCGAKFVIVGHSERRQYFDEKGEQLQQKVDQVLSAGLHVIFCVGESLAQRQAGEAEDVVAQQLLEGIGHLTREQLIYTTVAYEPVWAIGTGETASPEQAQEIHAHIRNTISAKISPEGAESISILYGGSVKPGNAHILFEQPDVDGGLVGGAALDEHQFIAIIRAAQSNL